MRLKWNKCTQHKNNIKITRALPANRHVYATLLPSRADFNKLSTNELFDILIKNEYEMVRIHGSAHPTVELQQAKKVDDKKVDEFKKLSTQELHGSSTNKVDEKKERMFPSKQMWLKK